MELLQWISDHFVELIMLAAILELIACIRVYVYNALYIRKVHKWFEEDILREGSSGTASATLDPLIRLETNLHGFRASYSEKIESWNRAELKEKLTELSTRESLKSHSYGEWNKALFNTLRDAVTVFPLLGILGTVFAIGCQLSGSSPEEGAAMLEGVTKNFGIAIWTTVWGIVFGISFTLVNAFLLEPRTLKCLEIDVASGKAIDDIMQMITDRMRTGKTEV